MGGWARTWGALLGCVSHSHPSQNWWAASLRPIGVSPAPPGSRDSLLGQSPHLPLRGTGEHAQSHPRAISQKPPSHPAKAKVSPRWCVSSSPKQACNRRQPWAQAEAVPTQYSPWGGRRAGMQGDPLSTGVRAGLATPPRLSASGPGRGFGGLAPKEPPGGILAAWWHQA